MSREIIQIDTIKWLEEYKNEYLPGDIFTSLPDISELQSIYPIYNTITLNKYKQWFINTISLILIKTKKFIIFLQSDIRIINNKNNNVNEFIDKSYLISLAANQNNFKLLWHKICYNNDITSSKVIINRPNWSHLLCYVRNDINEEESFSYLADSWATPDVFPRGEMVWSRGIGLNCAITGISFLKYIANSKCIIDPFCGFGTVLAVANAVGIDSIGCELSRKRCRKASKLDLSNNIKLLGHRHCRIYGLHLPIENNIINESNNNNSDSLKVETNNNDDENDNDENSLK